jgi:hypothetical protein
MMSRPVSLLLLLLLLAAAGLGGYLLVRGFASAELPRGEPAPLGPLTRREVPKPADVEVRATRGAGATSETEARPGDTGDEGSAEASVGRILGRVTRTGEAVASPEISISPQSGQLRLGEDGEFEVTGVRPGEVFITVAAERCVPQIRGPLTIPAGRTLRADFDLEPGVRPAGRVVDALTQHGVEGVIVDFGSEGRARSDGGGRFACAHHLRPDALKSITCRHPDYDIATFILHPILDPGDILLAVGRGEGTVHGRILDRGAETLPATAVARLAIDMGGGRFELRREVEFPPTGTFRFPNVRDGIYEVTVAFPSTDIPARKRRIHVYSIEPVFVEVPLGGGTTLDARLLSRAFPVAGSEMHLVVEDGTSVAEGRTDRDGRFRLSGVEPGTYRLKVGFATGWFHTEPFEIAAEDPFCLLEVDGDARRLKAAPK